MADNAGPGRYFFDVPDGAHLPSSRDTPGAYRGLLFGDGTNDLLGPPEVFREDPDGQEDQRRRAALRDAAFVLVGVVATLGVVKAAPRVRRWWSRYAPGALRGKAASSQALAADEDGGKPGDLSSGEVSSGEVATAEFSAAVQAVVEDCRSTMGSEEAYRHLAQMLVAAAVFAQKVRLLSGVRLDDAVQAHELAQVLGELTHQQVTGGLDEMLAANPSFLDEQTSAALLAMFGGGRVVAGEYRSLRSDRVREALSLDPRP